MSCFPGHAPGRFTARVAHAADSSFVGHFLLLLSAPKDLSVPHTPSSERWCELLTTYNESRISEIKELEREGGRAITSFHGHLFPSHDRGNSKLDLLQDPGGKICRQTATANSTLGECYCGVSVIKGPFALKGFSTKDTIPAWCVTKRAPACSEPPRPLMGEVEAGYS